MARKDVSAAVTFRQFRTFRPPVWGRIVAMHAVWRSRRALAALQPHHLRDVGLSSEQVAQEIARPVWDVPSHWRC